MKVNIDSPYAIAYIHLKNIKSNLNLIKSRIKKGTKILIPVKSDAYGCGMIEIAQYFEKEVDYFGVAFPFEGVVLRKNKIKKPVLIFSEVLYKKDYEDIIKYRLIPTVFSLHSLRKFNHLGKKYNKKISVHINVDTGMGRLGIPYDQIFPLLNSAFNMKNIKVEGIYTHLSSADESQKSFTMNQLTRFQYLIDFCEEKSYNIPLFHVLNSAGIINYKEYCYDMVRPGIMFYGYFPDSKKRKEIPLKSGVTLKARIVYLKKVSPKTPISYGHTYYTKKNEMIASIGCGYGDGMSRLLSNKGSVLYQDKRCPIRGRVCMDQVMIDITHCSDPEIGDWVTLFGRDKENTLLLDEIARSINTIPYECLCLLGQRIKRVYLK